MINLLNFNTSIKIINNNNINLLLITNLLFKFL